MTTDRSADAPSTGEVPALAPGRKIPPIILRAAGTVRWSLPIMALEAVVGEDGSLFVTEGEAVIALEADGDVRWRHQAERPLGLLAAADGLLIHTEEHGRRLVARDQATGRTRWSLESNLWSVVPPVAMPNGDIIHQRHRYDARTTALCGLSSNGALLWSYEMPGIAPSGVLVMHDFIVATEGGSLVGLDMGGARQWIADRHGFTSSGPVKRTGDLDRDGYFTCRPLAFGAGRILVAQRWYDGRNLLVFDPAARAVAPLQELGRETVIPFEAPIAVLNHPELRVAGAIGGALFVYDRAGRLLFRRTVPWKIVDIAGDSEGSMVVLISVKQSYWDKYRVSYELHDACGLYGFDAHGNALFRWLAPGPMSGLMVLGRAGEVYCVSEARLWAIA